MECLKNSKRVYVDFSEPQVLGLTISTSGEHLAVWGPRSMTIYQVVGANSTGAVSLGPFNIRAQACVLHESSAVVLETGNPSIVQVSRFLSFSLNFIFYFYSLKIISFFKLYSYLNYYSFLLV